MAPSMATNMIHLHSPQTIDAVFRQRAAQHPDRIAAEFLNDGDGRAVYTYGRLDACARSVAVWLQRRGIRGCRALLLYDHARDFLPAFLGCLYAGVTAVPLPPPRNRRSLPRVAAVVANAQASVVLTTPGMLDQFRDAAQQHPQLAGVPWAASGVLPVEFVDDWDGPVSRQQDLALLQYTSGSTGDPKGAAISHGNVLHNSACISRRFGHDERARIMLWLPFHHDMGLIGGLLHPLLVGATLQRLPPATVVRQPARWLQAISTFRATTSGAPNFAYEMCLERVTDAQCADLDLSSWQVAFNGAEPVRAETLDRFAERFKCSGFRREAFYPCYGMAETTLLLSSANCRRGPTIRAFDEAALKDHRAVPAAATAAARQLVGCGQVIDDHQLAIVDPTARRILPPGAVGEIWTSGPSTAQGYWNRPDVTVQTFGDPPLEVPAEMPGRRWLRTGDLGFIDDGELFVTGRLKDLIIVRGKNHYPQDIEATVESAHEALQIGGSAAFSVDDGHHASTIVAVELNRRHWRNAPVREIVSAVRAAVSEQHQLEIPTAVLLQPAALPKTSSGKVQRRKCRQMFLDQTLAEIHRETNMTIPTIGPACGLTAAALQQTPAYTRPSAIVAHLKRTLAEMLHSDAGALDSQQSIRDLTLDSMQLLQLKLEIDDLLGREFDVEKFLTMPTIGQLARWCADEIVDAPMVEPAAIAETSTADSLLALSHSTAPGPEDCSDSSNLARFNQDFFGYMLDLMRRYGELVQFRWGAQLLYLVANPDDVKEIFSADWETYIRGAVWSPFQSIMGKHGLITSEGDSWRNLRDISRAAFSHQACERDAQQIAPIVGRYVASLRGRADGTEELDVMADMKRLTLQVIMQKLATAAPDDKRIAALADALEPLDDLWNVPSRFISQSNFSAAHLSENQTFINHHQQVMRTLDPLIYSYVDSHVHGDVDADDMLNAYIKSDVYLRLPTGQRRQFLRDMAVTMILTGFDTTSAALFWTIHLLAKHVDKQEKLQWELDDASGEVDVASLVKLPYLQAVIYESLRLYPPVWFVGREVTRDATLRGFDIPQGAFMLASPYIVHRNPWIWPDPLTFRPERFLDGNGSPFNRPGYIPFGTGPRFCIGRPLAMQEIAIVIQRLFSKFQFTSSAPVAPDLGTAFTLRPRNRVTFQAKLRSSKPIAEDHPAKAAE
jgi:acyl-CoA synthetase (AMP-forming)/AMP-acid ligase II/cytochrome P450/acyl carrier protein